MANTSIPSAWEAAMIISKKNVFSVSYFRCFPSKPVVATPIKEPHKAKQ
jgi:hypothetical protein